MSFSPFFFFLGGYRVSAVKNLCQFVEFVSNPSSVAAPLLRVHPWLRNPPHLPMYPKEGPE